ncbi:MAG: hypothetical protein V4613_11075 [Bacteroidota bacterium]
MYLKAAIVFLCLFNVYSVFSQTAIGDSIDIKEETVGEYKLEGFNYSIILKLSKDGSFIKDETGCSCFGTCDSRIFIGKYEIRFDRLKLMPETIIRRSKDIDTFSVDTTQYSNDKDNFLRKDFQIFIYGSFVYLLSEESYDIPFLKYPDNDYIRFANDFNRGLALYRDNGHYFRKNNEKILASEDLNFSAIPEKYRYLFLEKAINAEVIETIDTSFKIDNRVMESKRIKINKGAKDGVYVGLEFYKFYNCTLHIIAVETQISYGVFDYCPKECKLNSRIGDLFSTFVPD